MEISAYHIVSHFQVLIVFLVATTVSPTLLFFLDSATPTTVESIAFSTVQTTVYNILAMITPTLVYAKIPTAFEMTTVEDSVKNV